jgi:glycosyltransferase involved in cell wall biosynthesis
MSRIIITIPAYNEERTLPKVLEEIKTVMSHSGIKYSLLIVNDGSKDKTVEVAKKYGATVVSHSRNRGLAETFKTEMQHCLKMGADIIVHTDADGQYPSHYIPLMIRKIQNGADLVLGSRFVKGKYSGSLMKKIGNKAFASVFSGLLKSKITDTTTGFRAFNKTVAELPLINNFTYTQEQLIRVGKANLKIVEIPIRTNRTRKSRLFRNSFDYALKAWINILRIYRDFDPLKFFGRISLFFISLGILLGIYIVAMIMLTGNTGGTPRVILSMLLILVGIQIGSFGFLADMNRQK